MRSALGQLEGAQSKNSELTQILDEKSAHMEVVLRDVMAECLQREQMLEDNERLDQIIQELERRNKELNQMLSQQIFNQASSFKHKVMNTLLSGASVKPECNTIVADNYSHSAASHCRNTQTVRFNEQLSNHQPTRSIQDKLSSLQEELRDSTLLTRSNGPSDGPDE